MKHVQDAEFVIYASVLNLSNTECLSLIIKRWGIGEHERRRNKRVKKVNLRLPDPLDIAVATVEESLQVD